MRKTISLILVLAMVFSISVCVYAANESSGSTNVTYTGTRETDGDASSTEGEYYILDIPASMSAGDSKTVSVEGFWARNRTLSIVADNTTVTMTNADDDSTKDLAVTFAGITKAGSNTAKVSAEANITIEGMSDVLFGNWSGTLTYTITME